jgi:hypothetical protein
MQTRPSLQSPLVTHGVGVGQKISLLAQTTLPSVVTVHLHKFAPELHTSDAQNEGFASVAGQIPRMKQTPVWQTSSAAQTV